MNSYDLNKIETPKQTMEGMSPYMTYGSGQVLKINDIELKFSQNSHAPKAILHMETKPISDPEFKPVQDAAGKVGKVACGIYMNDDNLKREFLQKMKIVASSMGIEDKINKIRSENFEEVVKDIAKLFREHGGYARYTIVASEYQKDGGRIGITLGLPKFKFVESENADPSTIIVFDKSNQYHYRKIDSSSSAGSKYGGAQTATKYGTAYQPSSKYQNYEDHVPDNPDDKDISGLPF